MGAGTLFALHPFTACIGSIATADALLGFLISLATLAGAFLARLSSWRRATLLGTLLGLGGATKLSPLLLAIGLAFGGLLHVIAPTCRHRRATPRDRAFASYGLIVALTAIVTFVTVYPYLWPDPTVRTRNLIAFRAQEMAAQAEDWPEMAVTNRAEALQRVDTNFTERFSLTASAFSLLASTSAPWVLRQIEVTLALLGVCIMLLSAVADGPCSPPFLATSLLVGQVLITILGMRSEFDRYHVPMALLGVVAAAVALQWIAGHVRSVFPGRRSSRQGEPVCGS